MSGASGVVCWTCLLHELLDGLLEVVQSAAHLVNCTASAQHAHQVAVDKYVSV